ncbi:hypothetical protein JSQ81_11750 [Sporosarcina sp. Marseille-Q4063]|uniref:hypothetical protein n=1 Tax=Sporosarcina sp. Marseille-Q4063 TaxID=2810514 RepID=UPI001BB05F4E|nr:hypothetical protein [Sporosarcina sp. Marseille-Q4063]QUW20533.1 hypothetical protein JSQ81_11750 [Sporosarcina sp. Marseille-Q4063]
MNWIIIIMIAVVAELIIRYLTRGMEDKKKRERMLSSLWLGFGVILILIWLFLR